MKRAKLEFFEALYDDKAKHWLAHNFPYLVLELPQWKTVDLESELQELKKQLGSRQMDLLQVPHQRLKVRPADGEDPMPIPSNGMAILTLPSGSKWYSAVFRIPCLSLKHPPHLEEEEIILKRIFQELVKKGLSFEIVPVGEKENKKSLHKTDLETFKSLPQKQVLELRWLEKPKQSKDLSELQGGVFLKVELTKLAFPTLLHRSRYDPVKSYDLYVYSPTLLEIPPMLGIFDLLKEALYPADKKKSHEEDKKKIVCMPPLSDPKDMDRIWNKGGSLWSLE